MDGLFGGSQTIATSETPLAGFNVQSSVYGKPVPLLYGRNRLAGNLIDYDDFKAIPHTTSSSSSGGKGGGGITSTNTSYTYQTSFLLGLCEGPVSAINAFWLDKEYHVNANVFTKFLGSYSQTAWATWTSKHPTKALAYRGLAYTAAADYNLGGSASLGNHSFDITGRLPFNAGTIDGANPKAILEDYLTAAHYSAGFPVGYLGDWTAYSNYCIANGIFLSPAYETQQEARQAVDELIRLTNAGVFFSEALLKIVPYSDQSATGNGVTYTPNVTPAYDLDDDAFLDHDQPVRVLRTPTADASNQVQIEFRDAANQYNIAIATAQDQASIEVHGLRPMDIITAHAITDAATARLIAQLILQRVLYTRNTYEFRIGWRYSRLEPCDYVTLTDERLGLDHVPVRILSVEEDEEGQLTLQAEDAPAGVHSSPLYTQQPGGGYAVNYNVAPGNVVAPAFFEVPATQALSGLAVAVAVTGNSADWGGAEIWVSNDGTSYAYMGQTIGGARYGTIGNAITAAVGQVPQVTLAGNGGQILSGSTADANNLSTLCLIDDEFVGFTTATLISANVYDLTLALRGAHSTTPAAHSIGAPFFRVDDAVAYSDALDLSMVGKTLSFKFLSFNKWGGGKQQLADVTAYTYTVEGTMAMLPPPPISAPTATASENSIFLDWTNPADATTDRVEVWRSTTNVAPGAGGSVAVLAGSVRGPVGFFADYLGAAGLTRYYWLRAINLQQFPSAFTAVASATTGAVTPGDGTITHAKLAVDAVWAGNIKAGEVQAGHMAANSITAGAIAANAVTTGKIAAGSITAASGAIADLAVSTLKIQDQAVTIPLSVSSGAVQWKTNTGLLPITIVSSGAPVWVSGILFGYKDVVSRTSERVQFTVQRNGIVIQSCSAVVVNPTDTSNPFYSTLPFGVRDVPGAGTHTYRLFLASAAGGFSVDSGNMIVLETKK
jgi:hypothetical protein